MAYNVPSLQITQEFTQLPVFTDSPLAALIIGPHKPIGAITAITVDVAGSSYETAPTVVITDTTGSGAEAIAVLVGDVVDSVTIVKGGSNYSSTPTVTFTGGGGSGATVDTVTVSSSHTISQDYVGTIGSVGSVEEIIETFGDVEVANTLAYGLKAAVNNAAGTRVYYAAVDADDEEGYAAALELAEKNNVYYGLVALTHDATIQNDLVAHVYSMSAKEKAKWRTCWLSPAIATSGSTDEKITDFLTKCTTAATVSGSGANANAGPRRVHNVFPDKYNNGDNVEVEGYFLAAALAGLRAGSVPHQSLTNTQVIEPYYLTATMSTYTEDQLDTLAAAGVWIVTQDKKGGSAYTRHQLTGDATNLNYREDSVTANVDSISYGLQSALAPYVGIYNISPASLLKIRTAVDNELSYRLTNTYTARAGNQLLGYKIVSITQNATFQDKVDVVVQLTVPYPMNYITVTLSI
jgi:hypothetical protein